MVEGRGQQGISPFGAPFPLFSGARAQKQRIMLHASYIMLLAAAIPDARYVALAPCSGSSPPPGTAMPFLRGCLMIDDVYQSPVDLLWTVV